MYFIALQETVLLCGCGLQCATRKSDDQSDSVSMLFKKTLYLMVNSHFLWYITPKTCFLDSSFGFVRRRKGWFSVPSGFTRSDWPVLFEDTVHNINLPWDQLQVQSSTKICDFCPRPASSFVDLSVWVVFNVIRERKGKLIWKMALKVVVVV